MTIKLVSITFENAPRVPGVRPGDMSTIQCENPNQTLVGWRAVIRGAMLFLVSPKGWKPGSKTHEWDASEPAVIHEIPRTHCFMHWEGELADIDAVLAKGKFETPAFGPVTPVIAPGKSLLAQLDPSQIGDA